MAIELKLEELGVDIQRQGFAFAGYNPCATSNKNYNCDPGMRPRR